jgi:SAM-dependent methyltransferase
VPATSPIEPPPAYFDARAVLAASFLSGEGLEIGPLHLPLRLPAHARARYVDRMPVEDLRREYPELADWDLTPVDVIDDGEALTTIAAETQDFIVANHFLEHCENPIATIETHLQKLKPGGVLFYAVPDKLYTFDHRRPATPLDHMIEDYERGPEGSRREHYDEWARLVDTFDGETEEEMLARARRLEVERYSIHMHVWTQVEFLRLILACRELLDEAFDLEAASRQTIEFIVVLRKPGPLPPPSSAAEVPSPPRTLRARGRRALRRLAPSRRATP